MLVEAAGMALLRSRFPMTLRGAGGWIAAFGLGCGFVWLVHGEPPAEQDLRHWRGALQEVFVGGEGHATWMTGEVEGVTHRFKSYHGQDWPGMEDLTPGAVVELWYQRDALPQRSFRPEKTDWIWRLVRDGEEIVPYEGVAGLWRRDRTWIGWAAVGLLAASAAVWMVGRSRDADAPRVAAPNTRAPSSRPSAGVS